MISTREPVQRPIRLMLREVGRELTRPPRVLTPACVRFIASKAFTRSDAWIRLRYDVMRDQGGRCQCCGRGVAGGRKVDVDHIVAVPLIRSRTF